VAKEHIKAFWNVEACGERYGDEQERLRYQLEPEILTFASFSGASGLRVLEIGVGMGADYLRWLRAGATATGIDLTERAVALAGQRVAADGLEADLRVANAERLPFEDEQFDLVYSWGVLHHTPDTAGAFSEAQRVLKPGGRLKVMIYHRHSWVALAAWVRFCLLRGRPHRGLRYAVSHVESPGTKAFTDDEARELVPGLVDVRLSTKLTHWDRKWAPGVSRLFGDRFGWFLLIEGTKPTS